MRLLVAQICSGLNQLGMSVVALGWLEKARGLAGGQMHAVFSGKLRSLWSASSDQLGNHNHEFHTHVQQRRVLYRKKGKPACRSGLRQPSHELAPYNVIGAINGSQQIHQKSRFARV